MTISLVSTLPKQSSAPAASAGEAEQATAGSQDFASLLMSQLIPVAQTPNTIELPDVQLSLEDAEFDPAGDESARTAALLASLGADLAQEADAAASSSPATDVLSAAQAQALIANPLAVSSEQISEKISDKTRAPIELEKPLLARLDLAEKIPLNDKASVDQAARIAVNLSALSNAAASVPNTLDTDALSSKTLNSALNSDAPLQQSAPQANALAPSPAVSMRTETTLAIPTPVREQSWANDFAQKIFWLASNDKQSAQLTLNPAQMGPIEVSISIDKGHASASFVSANADVREALESALPRLREMFANAGIELGQANVGAESFQQQANLSEQQRVPRWRGDQDILTEAQMAEGTTAVQSSQGTQLIDIFA